MQHAVVLALAAVLLCSGVTCAMAGAGDIRTVAGGLGAGSPTDISQQPLGLALAGTTLYVADVRNSVVRAIDTIGLAETVVAGNGGNRRIGTGGPALLAEVDGPNDVAVDAGGNLYISSAYLVWKVVPSGTISIIAGHGAFGDDGDGGAPQNATFKQVTSVAADAAGNVYLADRDAHRVRRINAATGRIEAFAGTGVAGAGGDGGAALGAQLSSPEGIAVDGAGNVFIADGGSNNRVRKVDTTGTITTLATIPGLLTRLDVDASGNVYVAERTGDRVFKVEPNGTTTLVGTLPAGAEAYDVVVDAGGNLFVADYAKYRVWKIDASATVTPLAGNGLESFGGDGGPADLAQLAYPGSIAFDATGSIVVTDLDNQRIRRIDRVTQVINTIAGIGGGGFAGDGGPATLASLQSPTAVVAAASGDLYVADAANYRIRKIDPSGTIATIAGNGSSGNAGNGGPATGASIGYVRALALANDGSLYLGTDDGRIRRIDLTSGIISHVAGNGTTGQNFGDDGPAATAQMSVNSLAVDGAGNVFVGADASIRRIDALTQVITRVAGDNGNGESGDGGDPLRAEIPGPVTALAVDSSGTFVYFAARNRVRRIDRAAQIVTGFAGVQECCGYGGDGNAAAAALLGNVHGLLVDGAGGLVIADTGNRRIRRVEVPVCGDGTLTPPTELCDDGGTQDGDFHCDHACRLEPHAASDDVDPGGNVSTGTDATAAMPFVTTVTMPTGGHVELLQAATTVGNTGFSVLGVKVDISVTPTSTVSDADPITMEFTIDGALIPSGENEDTIQVVKDGVPVANACDPIDAAIPGPTCVAKRTRLVNGDVRILVNTLTASDWSFQVACGPEPLEGCFASSAPGKAVLIIKNDPLGYAKDSLTWTLSKGEAMSLGDFGDPLTDTGYTMCLYHRGGLQLRAEIPAGGACAGRPCWKSGPKGFTYDDKALTPNGIAKLQLVAGGTGKAKLQVKGSGANLLVPRVPLNPPVTIQLRSTNGSCWTSTFSNPQRVSRPSEQFKAKSD